MSLFDFPRVNFHGNALLDTATANNGYNTPTLTLFDQDRSLPYMPPRFYLRKAKNGLTIVVPAGLQILKDENGEFYVPIKPINDTNYQEWATTPLGTSSLDSEYHRLYTVAGIDSYNPGYWNYFGGLSMELQDVKVIGITVPDAAAGTVTHTQPGSCPADLSDLLGAELSFNYKHGMPGSRTSAYLSDVDSIGQMCTQIFCGTAGLYDSNPEPLFTGHPVKSTARWMNLSRVLNWTFSVPMGGSACFYAMIDIEPNSRIAAMFLPYLTKPMQGLFMKLLIHEVYEVRSPDYAKIPTITMRDNEGNPREIPKNPTSVGITGSITPWFADDMKTAPICRIMKGARPVTINPSGIPDPVQKGTNNKLGIWTTPVIGPVQFISNSQYQLLSFDFINAINEYGIKPGLYPSYSGEGDIQPFGNFVNYNYGTLNIYYVSNLVKEPYIVGQIPYDQYEMSSFLQKGGVIDLPVQGGGDYMFGYFFITVDNDPNEILREELIYITTDQQGIYAEQNQNPPGLYMSDGLPREPFILRVFNRGHPVLSKEGIEVTLQQINMALGQSVSKTKISVYDGMPYVFDVDQDGCNTYVFAFSEQDLWPDKMPENPLEALKAVITFAMRASLVVLRVLASTTGELEPYLNGTLPITWDVVYKKVFILYKTLYPVMDIILPMNEQTWSDTTVQNIMLDLISEENWNQPLYMPVTRDLTTAQRKLLQMWVQQSKNTNA